MKKKVLSVIIIAIFSFLVIAYYIDYKSNFEDISNAEVNSKIEIESLLQSIVEEQKDNYVFELPSFYTDTYMDRQKESTEVYVNRALELWPLIENYNSEINLDYSNISALYERANYLYDQKIYPYSITYYQSAEGDSRRVITYYELEKGIVSKNEVYKLAEEKLLENQLQMLEISNTLSELEVHLNKDNFSNILALQWLVFNDLKGIENYIYSLRILEENDDFHVMSSSIGYFDNKIEYMKEIIEEIENGNLVPDEELIDAVMKDRGDILTSKLESNQNEAFDSLIERYLGDYNKAKEMGFNTYAIKLEYDIDAVVYSLQNDNFVNNEIVIESIMNSRNEMYHQLIELQDQYNTKWFNSRFNIMHYDIVAEFKRIIDLEKGGDKYLNEDLIYLFTKVKGLNDLIRFTYLEGSD